MVTAANLRDRAAQLVESPAGIDQIRALAFEIQQFQAPPEQAEIIRQAFENLALAHAAFNQQTNLADQYQIVQMGDGAEQIPERLIDDQNEFLNIDLYNPQMPLRAIRQNQPQIRRQIAAQPNRVNQENPPAVLQTSLLSRIWQTVKTALQTFVTWVLSFVCCIPKPPSGLLPPRPEQLAPPNMAQIEDLPPGKFQGRLNWQQIAPEGVSENCALEFLIRFWDHLRQGGSVEEVSELIDQSIVSAAAMDQQGAIRALFPRIEEIHFSMNLSNIERLARLEFNAIANREQKMRGAVVKIEDDSHVLLVDARTRGGIRYYHFNPQGNPAYFQAIEDFQGWIEHLNREIGINGAAWTMKACTIEDPVNA